MNSLIKIVSGITKTLNIAGEIIPYYEKISNGIKKVFIKKEIIPEKKTTESSPKVNNPVFFK